MKDIILHIGIQGTGTTFLQEEVFPNLENVNLICKKHKDVLRLLRSENLSISDLSKIEPYLKDDCINLISDENIWWPHSNSWFQEDVQKRRILHLEKVKEIFPKAKVIFGVRDTDELLTSFYGYYLVYGGYLSFKKWQIKYPFFAKENLDPKMYLDEIDKKFGMKKVFIYDFKDIRSDVKKYIKGFSDFIGIDTPEFNNQKRNFSHSVWQMKVARLINRFFRSQFNIRGIFPERLNPQRIIFLSEKFPKRFRGRNPNLSDLLNENERI
jgi:sulfotransferase family protein